MKTTQSILTDEDADTIYSMVNEYFGTMRADAVYYDITHQQY